jgi:hypothetical protein
MDIKIDRGSMIRMKSRPRTKSIRRIVSPPRRASGMRRRARKAVAAPRRTDHAERADLEMRLASGMVNEPIMGMKIIRGTMRAIFI